MNILMKKLISAGLAFAVTTGITMQCVNAAETELKYSDLVIIKRYLLSDISLASWQSTKYDVNHDGRISIMDFSIASNMLINNKKPVIPDAVNIDMNMILQEPELPTGCEVTSLTMLINYYGFKVSKTYLADLMPKFQFYYFNGELIGADFLTDFPGDPYTSYGYGCYTPCMVTTAENYFTDIGKNEWKLKDITGSDIDTLYSYIAQGKPVMVWATMGMIASVEGKSWKTPSGRVVTWRSNEHCLVLTGYDKNKGIVYMNDPMKGKVTYSASLFQKRYEEMGKHAAIITEGNEIISKPPSSGAHWVGEQVKYKGPVYYSSYGGNSVYVDGTFTITEIVEDPNRAYRIRLGQEGWVPYDF